MKKIQKLGFTIGSIAAVVAPVVAVASCSKREDVSANFIKQGSYQDAGRILKANKADVVPFYSDARKDLDKDVKDWALERSADGKSLKNTEVLAVSDPIYNNGLVSTPKYSQEVNAKLAEMFEELVKDPKLTVTIKDEKTKQVFDATYSVKSYNKMVEKNGVSKEPGAKSRPNHVDHNSTFGKDTPSGEFVIEFVASRDPEQINLAAKKIVEALTPLMKKEWNDVSKVTYHVASDYSIAAERVAIGTSSMGFLPYNTFDSIIKSGRYVHMFAQASRNHLKWDVPSKYTTIDKNELVNKANNPKYIYEGEKVAIESSVNDAIWYRSMLVAKKGQKVNGVLLRDLFKNPTQEMWDKVKKEMRVAHGSTTSGASYLMPQAIFKEKFGKFGFKTFKDMFDL